MNIMDEIEKLDHYINSAEDDNIDALLAAKRQILEYYFNGDPDVEVPQHIEAERASEKTGELK